MHVQSGQTSHVYKVFVVSITLTVLLMLSAIFLGMSIRTRQLIYEENITQARSLFNSILLTRKWNAHYGGVYVEKKNGITSNPYLVSPDITSVDGTVYTKRNPALMTREISEYAASEGLFRFHITSLNPLNPGNSPDLFERQSLEKFSKGQKETYVLEVQGEQAQFRYMAPLHVEQACLPCHAAQGYKVGDIRGGLSVSFDVAQVQQKLRRNTLLIILAGLTAAISLLGLFYFFTRRLIKKVEDARRQIETMAITDGLTGLYNRRHLIERSDQEFKRAQRLKKNLSCIMIDIDHFKSVNDEHGHLAGDRVLSEVASRLRASLRAYDIIGRYGGEEFLIILPDAGIQNAAHLAERLRLTIKETSIADIPVSISLGVTCMADRDGSVDDLIRRSDECLYRAKKNGRDRIESAP